MADVEETTDEVREDVESEVEEERARIDEVVHNDDTRVLDAIANLAEKLDGLRDMVSAFVDLGGVVNESAEIEEADDTPLFDDDVLEEIDEDVIRDLDKVEFND